MLNYDALRSLKAEAYPKLCARLDTVPTVFRDGDGNYKLRGDYFEKQTRIVLKNCEVIDPENILRSADIRRWPVFSNGKRRDGRSSTK